MIKKLENYVLYAYLFIMLGFFPLFFKKQYSGMGSGKFKIFLYSSLICFGILLLLSIARHFIATVTDFSKAFSNRSITYSITDLFVIVYYAAVLISFFLSSFKEEGMMGANGWNMGLVAQTIFFLSYFYISRGMKYKKWILYTLFISSGIVFLLGILHRFYIDPLQIYPGLSTEQKLQFLSTMGQSSWYSSFLCTVFPVGMYVFYSSQKKQERIWSGIYTALAFMTLVTQNTDSAYLALLAVLMVLLFISYDSKEKLKRFWQIILIMLGSFQLMGILQRIAGENCVQLDTLSVVMSQGVLTTVALIIAGGGYIYFYRIRKQQSNMKKPLKRITFYILLGLMSAGIAGTIVFIVLNSTGVLYEKFRICNTNNYLLFQNTWGNNRGFTWHFTCFSFKNLTFVQKLFGVGPDCFKAYNYSIPEYAEVLNNYWSGLSLTNAHNEYLTVLFNLGIAGLAGFVMMIISAIYRFLKQRKENPFVAAFALSAAAYAVHNIFCYQQVCCTPFLFLLLGIGENLIRNKEILFSDKI